MGFRLEAFFILQSTREQWMVVFAITAAMYTFGAVFYLIFGSGERQKWDKPKVMAEPNIQCAE